MDSAKKPSIYEKKDLPRDSRKNSGHPRRSSYSHSRSRSYSHSYSPSHSRSHSYRRSQGDRYERDRYYRRSSRSPRMKYRRKTSRENSSENQGNVLYVSNLPRRIHDDDLKEKFEKYATDLVKAGIAIGQNGFLSMLLEENLEEENYDVTIN